MIKTDDAKKPMVKKRIESEKIICIIRRMNDEDLIDAVRAIKSAGISLFEVALDHSQKNGLENDFAQIKRLVDTFDDALIGVGTVMNESQVTRAIEHGACFVLSPHLDERVVARTRACGAVSIPGAMSVTEIVRAYQAGANVVKVFPAGTLGTSFFQNMQGPLAHIPLLAVGGVNEHNIQEFLRAGAVGVGLGGGLVRQDLIAKKDWNGLKLHAQKLLLQLDA